jgi:hypothetical protein
MRTDRENRRGNKRARVTRGSRNPKDQQDMKNAQIKQAGCSYAGLPASRINGGRNSKNNHGFNTLLQNILICSGRNQVSSTSTYVQVRGPVTSDAPNSTAGLATICKTNVARAAPWR